MGNMRIKFLLLIASIFLMILTIGCRNDESITSNLAEKQNKVQDKIDDKYQVTFEKRNLTVLLKKRGSDYINYFIYKDTENEIQLFSLEYSYNNSEDGWKYKEESNALEFAEKLKDINLDKSELEQLNYMLDETYSQLIYEIKKQSLNLELYSIISYLKSAVAANIRAIENNTATIEGTLSPTFLTGKTFFAFQEDISINVNLLKQNINILEDVANKYQFSSDLKLIEFIKETNEDFISFEKLYSFYISKSDFKKHILEKISYKKGDCKESCKIGCGSDWGCCGNYMGCCYYSSSFCLAHDLACTQCEKWYCGPGCKPDGPEGNTTVKLILG